MVGKARHNATHIAYLAALSERDERTAEVETRESNAREAASDIMTGEKEILRHKGQQQQLTDSSPTIYKAHNWNFFDSESHAITFRH